MASKKPGGGCKKAGRSKKKTAAKGTTFSQFVRGIISADQYFKTTKAPQRA